MAWNTQAALPVSRSSAMIASDVSVPGTDVFSPVATSTRLRVSSMVGSAQIGAPEGPRSLTPVLDTLPVYSASFIVWYSHSLRPSFSASATTAPWKAQHSNLAFWPVPTPEAE